MPKDQEVSAYPFRGVLAGAAAVKQVIDFWNAYTPSRRRSAQITIPTAPIPNFTWNGSQYSQDVEPEQPKKPKIWRSIEEPFEPGW